MQSTPRVVILAYAGFHDERNTFARSHRRAAGLFNDLGPVVHPYARLERGDRLRVGFADVTYREFPLARHSTLMDFAARRGWTHVDIAVDANLPGNTNRPHDGHPSAAAHRKYADGLEQVLRAELSTSTLPPARE